MAVDPQKVGDALSSWSDDTDVTFAGIRFTIEEMPAVLARRVWREILHAMGGSPILRGLAGVDFAGPNEIGTIFEILSGILQLDVDFVLGLQEKLFRHVMFTSAEAVTPQPVSGAEPMSLDHLDVVEVDELMIRALAVNFTDPLRKLVSKLKTTETPETSPSPSS